MSYSLKENLRKRAACPAATECAGLRRRRRGSTALRALEEGDKAVVSNTSCLEVSTFMYPYTAYEGQLYPQRL